MLHSIPQTFPTAWEIVAINVVGPIRLTPNTTLKLCWNLATRKFSSEVDTSIFLTYKKLNNSAYSSTLGLWVQNLGTTTHHYKTIWHSCESIQILYINVLRLLGNWSIFSFVNGTAKIRTEDSAIPSSRRPTHWSSQSEPGNRYSANRYVQNAERSQPLNACHSIRRSRTRR